MEIIFKTPNWERTLLNYHTTFIWKLDSNWHNHTKQTAGEADYLHNIFPKLNLMMKFKFQFWWPDNMQDILSIVGW